MIEWREVTGSSRVVAEAYEPESERIYVRFPDGVEWWYAACSAEVWDEFSAPGQSRGQYISQCLDHKPNGRHAG